MVEAKASQQQLRVKMEAVFEETMEQVMTAVNDAPGGRVIAGSEREVKRLMDEFKRKAFEAAVQLRTDSAESAFSPSDRRTHG